MKLCSTCRLAMQSCESMGGPTSRLPHGGVSRRPPHCMVGWLLLVWWGREDGDDDVWGPYTAHSIFFFFLMNSSLFSLWVIITYTENIVMNTWQELCFVVQILSSILTGVLTSEFWGAEVSLALLLLTLTSILSWDFPAGGLCSCGLKCCRSGTTSFKI